MATTQFKELDEVWVRQGDHTYPGFIDCVLEDGKYIVRLPYFIFGEPVYIEALPEEVVY